MTTLCFQSFEDLLMSDLWMWGITPPPAIVPLMRVSSSSSPRIASCRCLSVMRLTFSSLLALPASSKTSAVSHSKIAAEYTAAVAPTLPWAATLDLRRRWIRPTGNCKFRCKRLSLCWTTSTFFFSVNTEGWRWIDTCSLTDVERFWAFYHMLPILKKFLSFLPSIYTTLDRHTAAVP